MRGLELLPKSGAEATAVQTLRDCRAAPKFAKRLDCGVFTAALPASPTATKNVMQGVRSPSRRDGKPRLQEFAGCPPTRGVTSDVACKIRVKGNPLWTNQFVTRRVGSVRKDNFTPSINSGTRTP
jgi:hypothetical protein